MCEPRTWNKLFSEELTITEDEIFVHLIGERSDYETFKVSVEIKKSDSQTEIAYKFKKAYERLESYRNCDCTTKTGECIRHIVSIHANTLPPEDRSIKLKFGRNG